MEFLWSAVLACAITAVADGRKVGLERPPELACFATVADTRRLALAPV